ncbi:MAG: bile acid:sodium symporter family protein [Desulfitobacterium hafniense]|nr:bile acid:sodium symporter family protein [Desulfitobacterium hafniense]
MFNYLTVWNRWLGQRMIFVSILALLIGFNLPLPKVLFSENVTIICFVYLTFITSLDVHFRDFIKIIKRPILPLGMLVLIHIVMPIVAWGIGYLFFPHDFNTRLGLLISSAIPVGLSSIVWTGIGGGNIVLALVVVVMDTLLSPIILPGFFALVVGENIQIEYSQMIIELIWMVAVPSFAAMTLNDITQGKLEPFSRSIGGLTAKIGVFFIILVNAAIIAPEIEWGASLLKLLFVIFLLTISGYLLGYLASFALKDRSRSTVISMVYNVGMRNISFGFVLALTYFPTAVAVPITLASVYNQPLASIVSWVFNRKAENHMSKSMRNETH